MSRIIANVEVTTDTFQTWVDKTNELASAFAETVTLVANTVGESSSGNGFVTGVFGANTLVATSIRGGSVSTSANLSISSNVSIGNVSSQVTFSHNDSGNFKTTSYATSNTDDQILDSFSASSFRSGKYLISIKDNVNSDYQSTEIMLLHDGTTAYTTEYATLISDVTLATFSANINAGSVRLYVKPTNADNKITYHRTLLAV